MLVAHLAGFASGGMVDLISNRCKPARRVILPMNQQPSVTTFMNFAKSVQLGQIGEQ